MVWFGWLTGRARGGGKAVARMASGTDCSSLMFAILVLLCLAFAKSGLFYMHSRKGLACNKYKVCRLAEVVISHNASPENTGIDRGTD